MSVSTSAELQEVYALLEEIEQKLQAINSATGATDLEGSRHNMNEMRITTNEVRLIATRLTSVLGRMGMPENLTVAMDIMQRMIVVANSLRVAMLALQMSNPVGLAMAGLGVASSLISLGSMAGRYG